MQKISFFLFTFLFLMSSCKFQKDSTSDYDMPNDQNVEIYKFDSFGKDSVLRYSEIYSKVDYIPLETTNESLIAEVTRLEVLENDELLVFDNIKGSVLLFDKNGKFIRHIGHKGNGHDEYNSPELMAYDRYSRQVVVYDSAKSRLLFYNLLGNFISAIDINMFISDMAVIDNEHLCVYMDYRDDLRLKQKGYNIKIINKKGLIVSEYKEYGEEMKSFHPASENTFFQSGDDTYFMQPYSYLVSSINVNGPTERFYLDFNKYSIPREWIPGINMDIMKKVECSENIAHVRYVYFIKDKIVMNILRATRCTMYYLDTKDRNKDKYAGHGMINDLYGLVTSKDSKTARNDKLYLVVLPDELTNCQSWVNNYAPGDNLSEKQKNQYEEAYKTAASKRLKAVYKAYMESGVILTQKDIDLVNSVHEEDNPIIQVCTLKD